MKYKIVLIFLIFLIVCQTVFADDSKFYIFTEPTGKGYMDETGIIVMLPQYSSMTKVVSGDDRFIVTQKLDSGFNVYITDIKGNITANYYSTHVVGFSDGVANIYLQNDGENGYYTAIDKDGNVLFRSESDFYNFSCGYSIVIIDRMNYGYYINKSGELQYHTYGRMHDASFKFGLGVVENARNLYTVYDTNLNPIVQIPYYDVCAISEDLLSCFNKTERNSLKSVGKTAFDKYGLVDLDGNIVVDFQYDYIGMCSEDLIPVGIGDTYGYIDKSGSVIIPLKYRDAKPFINGFAVVRSKENGLSGIIDKSESYVVEPKYKNIANYGENLFYADNIDWSTVLGESRQVADAAFWIDLEGNEIKPRYPKIKLNGSYVETTNKCFKQGESIMIPLREFFEYLGAQVQWNGETSSAEVINGEDVLSISFGDYAFINNEPVLCPERARIIGGVTYIPCELAASFLGIDFVWSNESAEVIF